MSESLPRFAPNGVDAAEADAEDRTGVGMRVSMRRISWTLRYNVRSDVIRGDETEMSRPAMGFLVHHLRIYPIDCSELGDRCEIQREDREGRSLRRARIYADRQAYEGEPASSFPS
jgi:hypothetical protein